MTLPFLQYAPPGPVAAQFLQSNARVRAMMGPVGSGKTGACLMEMLYRAMGQVAHTRDFEMVKGEKLFLRRSRFLVVRSNNRDLEETTLKSWLRWVPQSFGHFTGGSGGVPAEHVLMFNLGDGTAVRTEVQFVGLGAKPPDEALPGREITGAYLNEWNLIPDAVRIFLRQRIRRYPERDNSIGFGGCNWGGIWGDFNGVDQDHQLYKQFVEKKPATWEFFRQPGAMFKIGGQWVLNPNAENLSNLPDGYYDEQIDGQEEWAIRSKIGNEWVSDRSGDPVYSEWDEFWHAAPVELPPIPGVPLFWGADAGLHGAICVGQRDPGTGQIRILDEMIAPEGGKGAEAFGEECDAIVRARYPGFKIDRSTFDPTGNARAASDERGWAMIMQAKTGVTFIPADSNVPGIRQSAVRGPLLRKLTIEGRSAPGIIVSKRCKVLIKGFNGSYKLRRTKDAEGRLITEPEKNHPFSDIHDALQYLCMGYGEHLVAIKGRTDDRPRQTRAEDDYHQAEYGRDARPPDWAPHGHNSQRQEFADD